MRELMRARRGSAASSFFFRIPWAFWYAVIAFRVCPVFHSASPERRKMSATYRQTDHFDPFSSPVLKSTSTPMTPSASHTLLISGWLGRRGAECRSHRAAVLQRYHGALRVARLTQDRSLLEVGTGDALALGAVSS
jgi:hypothetical protein